MRHATVTRNASMAAIQSLVSGGILFVLYRYLLQTIGPEQVGIWSIVLAAASVSRITDLGITGSAVKFTAKYIARNELSKASEIIQTTAITIGVILAGVLAIGCFIIDRMMPAFIPVAQLQITHAILPYALLSVWIGSIAGVFSSGLEGCQRTDLRAWMSIVGSFFSLGLTLLLVPYHGLIGLAWAQIGQGILMLIGSRFMLKRALPSFPLLPSCWRFPLFKEMLSYGANFQVASIFSMLLEPVTKALMAKFGGLSMTAYYEMANRMVIQFRSLLVAANQAIVPRIATLHEREPRTINATYHESYRIMFSLSLPLYTGIAAGAPLISELWIGHYEQTFIDFSILLSVGFWINNLNAPAYFINLGTGALRWNTISHVAIGLMNAVLGYILGIAFGGSGVILGYVVALIVGSCIIVFGYHHDNHIPLSELVPAESKILFMACCIGMFSGLILINQIALPDSYHTKTLLPLVLIILIITPACWLHPIRARLLERFIGSYK
jgi:O-antigen/teichoic acid export membrane protein